MLYSAQIKVDKIQIQLSGTTEEGVKFSYDSATDFLMFNEPIENEVLKECLEGSVRKVANDITEDMKSVTDRRNYEAYYKVHP
jgi:hypothetical protein